MYYESNNKYMSFEGVTPMERYKIRLNKDGEKLEQLCLGSLDLKPN